MKLNDLDFNLPDSLIAKYPEKKRDECRLLIYSRDNNSIHHTSFKEIINHINKDDILIFNNTKVYSARLHGLKKGTGAKIEIFLLEKKNSRTWKALIKPSKRIKPDTEIIINNNISIKPAEEYGEGQFLIEFSKDMDYTGLEGIGEIPLPPYIKRPVEDKIDREYYQTVYAKKYGAAAAPTAGFHFTERLIDEIKNKGIRTGEITLHISYATFSPIRTENVEDHKMHSEYLIVPGETVELVNSNKKGRVIAVGTTVVRGLESAAVKNKNIKPFQGFVDTFILPDHSFKAVDAVITNFHLPKSTLLLLVSAFIGLDKLKDIYREAIEKSYRFFSYGDAMMIL